MQSINSGCPVEEQADKALAYCRGLGAQGDEVPSTEDNGCRASQGWWQCQLRTVVSASGRALAEARMHFSRTNTRAVPAGDEHSTATRSGSGRVTTTQQPQSLRPFSRWLWNRLPLITTWHRKPRAHLQGRRSHPEKVPAGVGGPHVHTPWPRHLSAAPALGPEHKKKKKNPLSLFSSPPL